MKEEMIHQEAFGRVVLEAMINGIPVIGSQVGALNEVIGRGGLVIKDYKDPEEWVKSIKFFDDVQVYKKFSVLAEKQASMYDYKKEIDKVEDTLIILK